MNITPNQGAYTDAFLRKNRKHPAHDELKSQTSKKALKLKVLHSNI